MLRHSSFHCHVALSAFLCCVFLSLAIDYESGNIGCLYTMEVCQRGQVCLDDSLFGVCSSGEEGHTAAVSINVQQALELEQILSLLVSYEYPWESTYVQCILKAYLWQIEESPETPGFPEECNREEEERRRKQNLDEKLARVLDQDERDDEMNGGVDGRVRSVIREGEGKYIPQRTSSYRTGDASFGNENDLGGYGKDEEEAIERFVNELGEEEARRVEEGMVAGNKEDESLSTKIDVHFVAPQKAQPQGSLPDWYASKEAQTAPLQSMSTHALAPTADILQNFYRPSTRPFYKSFYSIPDPPSIAANEAAKVEPLERSRLSRSRQKYLVTMYILCGFILIATFLAVVLYFVRRRAKFREKFLKWVNKGRQDSTGDYQDLCRQHMQSKFCEKEVESPMTPPYGRHNKAIQFGASSRSPPCHRPMRTPSTNSSSSSWNDEQSNSNLDISTGHLILSYMEDHIRDKDRLQREWDELSNNDPEPCSIVAGIEPANMRKNRCTDIMPYEHTRVRLDPANNVSGSDYINANFIVDNDPRNPTYIITQGPLPHTVADFWQMIWEQNSVVIVNLTRLVDNGTPNCHRYWPEEGTELYHVYEVQLISEHVLCEDFVVRSLVLRCIQTSETRTVTQFHLTCWSSLSVPPSTRVLLDFRRKVNKSYRSRASAIVVHCGDGAGRSGTYCLIDMTINRLSKGAKEMNIAAGLEHLRDQRVNLVRTKDQFEYALTAIADEVQSVLNVPQM